MILRVKDILPPKASAIRKHILTATLNFIHILEYLSSDAHHHMSDLKNTYFHHDSLTA